MSILPSKEHPVCILAAMQSEMEGLLARLQKEGEETVSGITFHIGSLCGVPAVLAVCGIGKVYAALAAQTAILKYSPALLINTGVAGALAPDLSIGDITVAESLCQHDMDTSPLGDPVGLVSGINRIYFPADPDAVAGFAGALDALSLGYKIGRVASGDAFIADGVKKAWIRDTFAADCCEMEGAAIAQVAFVNGTPFAVLRAISDTADGGAEMLYSEFVTLAAKNSVAVLCEFLSNL